MITRNVILHVALLACMTSAAWAQVKAGGEFQINTYTTGRQHFPVVAVGRDADFTVVWTGLDADGYGVFGQGFAATGVRRGGEFLVNTYTTSDQTRTGGADISVDRRGNFVVVWPSYFQDGSGWGVFGQRHDSTGAPAGGEFQVNTYTTGDQGSYFAGSVGVASAPGGGFVVVWDAQNQDGNSYGILMRRYDAAGNPLGGETVVNTYTTGVQIRPDIAMDAEGSFVVVWADQTRDGSDYGVFGQRFDAAGSRLGGEFQVNAYTTGNQSLGLYFGPTVARAANGAFVAVWDDLGRDGSNFGVFAQIFDAQGNRVGSDFQVHTGTIGQQSRSAAAMDDLGNFVITWADAIGGGVFDVNARRFDVSGTRRGGEFLVNTYTSGAQLSPEIGSDDVGNFVVSWTASSQDGSGYGVFGQRFGGLRPSALRVSAAGNGVIEPGEAAVDVRPAWHNFNGAAQTFAATLADFTGPAGATYTIDTAAASYGTVPDGASAECSSCYAVTVSDPSPRPVLHWDATADERITPDAQGQSKRWVLHVGGSFADVSRSGPFYRFIETLLHHGVTGGCSATEYCPSSSTARDQMAVFVLVGKEGSGYQPPACTTPMFGDVPPSSPFCRWIEELARRGVVAGCGGGNYCPQSAVTREQMSVFVLRTLDPALDPPACTTPMFADVPASSPFCRWIEELARRGVVSGCGGGNYCPTDPVTREQMGVFMTVTFGLTLYGP